MFKVITAYIDGVLLSVTERESQCKMLRGRNSHINSFSSPSPVTQLCDIMKPDYGQLN